MRANPTTYGNPNMTPSPSPDIRLSECAPSDSSTEARLTLWAALLITLYLAYSFVLPFDTHTFGDETATRNLMALPMASPKGSAITQVVLVAFSMACLPLALYHRDRLVYLLCRVWPLLLLFLWCACSVVWSDSAARPRDSYGWVSCSSSFIPLSDTDAAALVMGMTENRASTNANANSFVGDANHRRPSGAEISAFLNNERDFYGRLPAELNPYAQYVTGGFTGTTDEIIQWGAAKWGIPVDWLRAQYIVESNWKQTGMGDATTVRNVQNYPVFSRIDGTQVYQSLGITSVKWNHPDDNLSGMGTEPLRWKSTAFNVDHHLSQVRFFFDNPQNKRSDWDDSTYSSCDNWLSIGAWNQPYPWNNSEQNEYVNDVKSQLANRTWEQSSFPPAQPTG